MNSYSILTPHRSLRECDGIIQTRQAVGGHIDMPTRNDRGGPACAAPIPMVMPQGSQWRLERLANASTRAPSRGRLGSVITGGFHVKKGAPPDMALPDPSRWIPIYHDGSRAHMSANNQRLCAMRHERYAGPSMNSRGDFLQRIPGGGPYSSTPH